MFKESLKQFVRELENLKESLKKLLKELIVSKKSPKEELENTLQVLEEFLDKFPEK